MQVRIDHRTGSVHFGTDLSEAQRTELPEGPTIQNMPSEQVIIFKYFNIFVNISQFELGENSVDVHDGGPGQEFDDNLSG